MTIGEPGRGTSWTADACMGSGNCVFWAPGVFDLDDDGMAVVVGEMDGHEEEVRRAAAKTARRRPSGSTCPLAHLVT